MRDSGRGAVLPSRPPQPAAGFRDGGEDPDRLLPHWTLGAACDGIGDNTAGGVQTRTRTCNPHHQRRRLSPGQCKLPSSSSNPSSSSSPGSSSSRPSTSQRGLWRFRVRRGTSSLSNQRRLRVRFHRARYRASSIRVPPRSQSLNHTSAGTSSLGVVSPALARCETVPRGTSVPGWIQALASISGFDLDAYRILPFSEITKAHGALTISAYLDPVAVVDAKNRSASVVHARETDGRFLRERLEQRFWKQQLGGERIAQALCGRPLRAPRWRRMLGRDAQNAVGDLVADSESLAFLLIRGVHGDVELSVHREGPTRLVGLKILFAPKNRSGFVKVGLHRHGDERRIHPGHERPRPQSCSELVRCHFLHPELCAPGRPVWCNPADGDRGKRPPLRRQRSHK